MQSAVIATGGRQYLVSVGSLLRVERLPQEVDQEIVFDAILMVRDGESVTIGKPHVSGASVTAKVRSQSRTKKIPIVKFSRRKHYEKKANHRQFFTEVSITKITSESANTSSPADNPLPDNNGS